MIRATRPSLFAAFALVLLTLAACGRQDTAKDEADVRTTLESFYAAMKNAENATAMALIAEDALFVEGGRLETREEYEKNHLPADISFEKQVTGKRGPWRITFRDDTAWAIATTDYDGIFDGAPVAFTSAQLAVLTREDAGWRIRSIHWSSRRR
jgi:ketosteroid isomerase-like protein